VHAVRTKRIAWLLVSVVLLVVLVLASVSVGARTTGVGEIVRGLTGARDSIGEAAVAVRLPRTVLALAVGAALALAGTVMQGVTRNPLADPGILGVNAGASLAVVSGMAWFGLSHAIATMWVAIGGAAVAAVFVYTVGSIGRGGATPLKLALAGAASTAAFASLVTAVSLPRGDIAESVRSWQIGGVGGATFDRVAQMLPFLAAGALLCLVSAKGLNSLALGDDLAAGLGERVALTRGVAAVGAVLLCGAATAVAGPIGFVGLVVPHAYRLLIGPDHRWLLPYTAVGGAVLLVAADVVGRLVARPSEVDVGIVTALVGAPFFIAVIRRRKLRSL
jgi:iron complex transport system permease protein